MLTFNFCILFRNSISLSKKYVITYMRVSVPVKFLGFLMLYLCVRLDVIRGGLYVIRG